MTQNLVGGAETSGLHGHNICRLPVQGMNVKRQRDTNAAWVGAEMQPVSCDSVTSSYRGQSPFAHAATDYEPPAWLAVDAPAMAVDGEQVWMWIFSIGLTMLVFAVMFKALVWFGGMP